jgi:cell division protein FtsN
LKQPGIATIASSWPEANQKSSTGKPSTRYTFKKKEKQLRLIYVDRFITGLSFWTSKRFADKFNRAGFAVNKTADKRSCIYPTREDDKKVTFKRDGLKKTIYEYFSQVFKSGLANTALASGAFSLALLFSLWYQGILPPNSRHKLPVSPVIQSGGPTTEAANYRLDIYGVDSEEANVSAVESSAKQANIELNTSDMHVEIPAKGLMAPSIDQVAEMKKMAPSKSQEDRHLMNMVAEITATDEMPNPETIPQTEPPAIQTPGSRSSAAQKSSDSVLRDTGESKSSRAFSDRPSGTYSLQIGAFLHKKNAARRMDMLEDKGYPANIVKFTDAKGRHWYTVRLGAYNSMRVAEKQAKDFSTKEKLESIVRPVGRF